MTLSDRSIRVLCCAALIMSAAACDDDPAGPREPGPPSQLTLLAGGDQQAEVGAQLPAPIMVRVTDSTGVALRGIAVEFAVTSGGGSTGGAVVTDSAGLASSTWTLGTSTSQPQRLRVRVIHPAAQPELTVSARAAAGAAATAARSGGDAQTGDLGQPLANPLTVVVTDRFGNPVAGVPVAWVVTEGGGTVSTSVQPTDSTGASSVRWTLGARLDAAQRITAQAPVGGPITFTATPRLPTSARLTPAAGAPTTGTVGREITTPFQVQLALQNGNPVEGAEVTWSVVSGQGTVTPTTTRTDASGRAAARLTLGNAPGQVVLAANVAGLQDVRFNVTAAADAPATLTIVGGNNQTAPIGTQLTQPLTLSVADRFGNLLTGVTVVWSVTSGGGTVNPGTIVTDATGRASTFWQLGTASGPQTVLASVAGNPAVSATFNATARSGAVASVTLSPATLSLQPGGVGQITATLRDQFNNLITDRTPTWTTSDTLVARVSQSGVVTAFADGTATITASIDGVFATATVTVSTPPSIPARPTNLVAETLSPTSVQLTWQLNSTNATRLNLEYREQGSPTWRDTPPMPGHATGFLFTNLSPQATYEFRIQACNNLGCSSFSDIAVATTSIPLAMLSPAFAEKALAALRD